MAYCIKKHSMENLRVWMKNLKNFMKIVRFLITTLREIHFFHYFATIMSTVSDCTLTDIRAKIIDFSTIFPI